MSVEKRRQEKGFSAKDTRQKESPHTAVTQQTFGDQECGSSDRRNPRLQTSLLIIFLRLSASAKVCLSSVRQAASRRVAESIFVG